MTTLLAMFVTSLSLALILSPVIGRLGTRIGAVDTPDHRKVHTKPIPRTGGLAIFIAFTLTLLISTFFMTKVSDLLMVVSTIMCEIILCHIFHKWQVGGNFTYGFRPPVDFHL